MHSNPEDEKIHFNCSRSLVKYLGVLLDTKLNWNQHLIDKRKKFYASWAWAKLEN
jgi:hypothetical protein